MEDTYKNDSHQGLSNIYQNLPPSEKFALKRQYKFNTLQSIKSIITYACPAWEFAVGSHLLKLQHLQN
jgi:hypothetical protein